MPTVKSYGLSIEPGELFPTRGVISEPERTVIGNLAFAAGNSIREGGWLKSVHCIMLPDEAEQFAHAILKELGKDVIEVTPLEAELATDPNREMPDELLAKLWELKERRR